MGGPASLEPRLSASASSGNLVTTISFRGVITNGVGKHVELHVPGRNEISHAPHDWPVTLHEGSLNVRIVPGGYPSLFATLGLPEMIRSLDTKAFPSDFEIAHHEFGNNRLGPVPDMPHKGSAQVWRATLLANGRNHQCWVLRRYGSGVGEQLELVSHLHMRSAFHLTNGQEIVVTLEQGNTQRAAPVLPESRHG